MKMNWKKIMFTGDSVTDCRRARPIGDGFGTIGESYLSRIFIDTWAEIPRLHGKGKRVSHRRINLHL